jgi:predicted TIM-barrel fold metal-dependent hydrolase
MGLSRRRFLKRTIGTVAACGFAQMSAASDTRPQSIADTHVYLGHWPHQQLSSDDPAKFVADFRQSGVSQAWVGSFDGLFHKDVASVNQRLVEACARVGDGMLIPFGTINPTLPDWEDDVRRCHEKFHMSGVRLHPSYHGYTLDDPRFARLMELAAARGLIVQLVVWMEAERHLLLNPHVAQVDLKPLVEKIAAFPKLKLLVANGDRANDYEGLRRLLPLKQVHFDFARAEKPKDVRQLIEKTSSDRVVFGSGTPLHDIDPVIFKLEQAQLADANRRAIAIKNASRLVAANRNR